MITRAKLLQTLDNWLLPQNFNDVAENGLQIEGKDEIKTVVCGVSANLALIESAVSSGADAIFVHHGLIWKGGLKRLDGWLLRRIKLLIQNGINLFAYHLPLDAHPTLGNNAGLAKTLKLKDLEPFGKYAGQDIGFLGQLENDLPMGDFVAEVKEKVGPPICAFGDRHRPIKNIALCSGGAPDLLIEAISKNVDLYLTGEPAEWSKALSEESGVSFIAAGHHQTERFGVKSVAKDLNEKLGLKAKFVDIKNPI